MPKSYIKPHVFIFFLFSFCACQFGHVKNLSYLKYQKKKFRLAFWIFQWCGLALPPTVFSFFLHAGYFSVFNLALSHMSVRRVYPSTVITSVSLLRLHESLCYTFTLLGKTEASVRSKHEQLQQVDVDSLN